MLLAGIPHALTGGAAPNWNSSALTGGKVESRMLRRRLRVLLSIVAGLGFGVVMPATAGAVVIGIGDRKSTRLNSSHGLLSRMPSSA